MKTFVKGILVGMTVLDMALLPFSCSGGRKKAVKVNPSETEPTVLTQTEDNTSVIDNSIDCVWIIKYNDVTKYIYQQQVDKGGYAVIWNKEIDLACDDLFYDGITIKSRFDGLIAARDATEIWGLNESTLRKAIQYGKLKRGIDVSKMGNQWIISVEAMVREYGEPKL